MMVGESGGSDVKGLIALLARFTTRARVYIKSPPFDHQLVLKCVDGP